VADEDGELACRQTQVRFFILQVCSRSLFTQVLKAQHHVPPRLADGGQ